MPSRRWFVADFETTGKDFYDANGFVRVWLWCVCDENAVVLAHGDRIETFLEFAKKRMKSAICYFHNLRFDGSFILDAILRDGWERDEKPLGKAKRFEALIGDLGQWYALTLSFTRSSCVYFYDSLKLLPFSVDKIAKDFGLPILKESIDYSDYVIDDKRIEYVDHDVRIVAMALKILKEEGMTAMTTASSAYSYYSKGMEEKVMINAFPDLGKEFIDEWRAAYRGGRSQVNPFFAGKILRNVYRYDVNSMYPWVMNACPLPFGLPIKIEKPSDKYRFALYKVRIKFTLKKDNFPCLLKKAGLLNLCDSYYVETNDIETIYISSVDLELVKRHYDVQFLEFLECYAFKTSTGLFKNYIGEWYARKCEDKGAKRVVDKLMLNSLYGKFGSKTEGFKKLPYIDEKKDCVAFRDGGLEQLKHYYIPLAIAVTSWAHKRLDDAITDAGVDAFVYCDTDSVHTLKKMDDSLVDSKKLGSFKLEAIEEKGKYIRQKTYLTYTKDEGFKITCAGMNDKIKKTLIEKEGKNLWKIFEIGFKCEGKLLPKRVKGGTLLYETSFEIKPGRNSL